MRRLTHFLFETPAGNWILTQFERVSRLTLTFQNGRPDLGLVRVVVAQPGGRHRPQLKPGQKDLGNG